MESQPDLQVDGREFLRRVFLSQRPLYVNLLDDLGSIDFCLIDGDALLLECLSSPLSDLRHGGQLLHIIYLVEDFLCSFKRCLNSRFSVVWFDNHKCLWQDAQQHFLLLARHVLQQHLAVTLQQSVHTFVSWQDAAWRQFVIEKQPAFVLMSEISENGHTIFTPLHTLRAARLTQACAVYHLANNLPVAFMTEISFQQEIAFGFKSTALWGNAERCRSFARRVGEELHKAMTAASFQQDVKMTQLPDLPWRTKAGVTACAFLLRRAVHMGADTSANQADERATASTIKACWAWCLQQAACDILPLQNRSLDLESMEQAARAWWPLRAAADEQGAEVPPVSPGADLVPLIGEWCGLADHLLTQAAELTDNDRASLIDLFDGRLWHFMYLCTAIGQPIGLPSHAMQVAERLFHAICQPSGLSEAQVSSFVVNQPLAVASGTALNGHEAPAANEPAFMTNPLINVFFGLQAEDLAVPEHQPEAASTAAQELQVFHDNFHWHTGVPIEPSYIGETQRANLLAEYQGANVYRMAECPHLSAGQRARARQVIRQQTDPLLWRQDPRERARQLTEAAQKAYAQLKVKLDKQQQLNARFLQRYGATMDATKYCMPNPAAQEAARSSRRAQSIISKNTANLRARAWSERHMQWSAVQLELQRYAERNNDCWDSYMVSRLVDFLEDGVERGISTDTFLAAQCFRLQGELNAWKKQCRKLHASVNASGPAVAAFENTPEHMLHAVNIWNTVQALLASGRLTRPEPAPANTSQAAVEAVAATGKAVRQALRLCKQAMQQLGFEHAADRIQTLLSALDPERRSRSRPASASAASSELCKVGMTETEFQLRFCGDVLQRSAPDAPDPRVVSFNPDAWQRRVLDAIDASESCVMCAPTSSGKTFISSFCMDRVLKSPDGIVVFVAPTKALVNQTAAQVRLDHGAQVGVFTRDFRYDEESARVLVTVPACLEILLFSSDPSHRKWVKRLQYVIFDEVHCMREGGVKEGGAAESSGAIWEHCLLMIRCPFLALSATIGNPEEVTGWLQDVKTLQQQQDLQAGIVRPAASYTVRLIQHSERFADLRCYRYDPSSQQSKDWEDQAGREMKPQDQNGRNQRGPEQPEAFDQALHRMHPCAVLEAERLQTDSFPPELSLEPSDCLKLYDSMYSALANDHDNLWTFAAQQALSLLAPDAYFTPGAAILRQQVRQWEAALKAELVRWACADSRLGLQAVHQALQQLKAASDWRLNPTQAVSRRVEIDDFNIMVKGLDQKGMLPAIAFSFDRGNCIRLAEGLLSMLEVGEAAQRAEQPIDVRQLRADALRAERAIKANRDRVTTRRDAENAQHESVTGYEAVDDNPVDPAFSLAGQRLKSMSKAEVEEWIGIACRKWEANSVLERALCRGIGVHHSGMPIKYRQVVEILFRCGHLRVVLATGTLAYGINMPCRTVIFVGDHIFLNSLQFRQMSGRAGRRGFDTLGHVIFMAVPQRKCASLLVSPVPQLYGNFPLTISLALRVMTLQGIANTDAEVTNDLLRLLQKPFYASLNPGMGQKMQHMFGYALAYLQQQVMLDPQGRPVEFAGMASHLFWAEPANFAFVTLLRKGVFHNICSNMGQHAQHDTAQVPSDVAHQILLTMSHLFERVQLKQSARLETDRQSSSSSSQVVLEPMSPEMEAIVAEHNVEALDNLLTYVSSYIRKHDDSLPPNNVLPMSELKYPLQHPADGLGFDWGTPVGGALIHFRNKVLIASPFVALSGQGEDFQSVEQVVQCMRPGVLLNAASVPSVRTTDRHGRTVPLNRYILDFWSHGQKRQLMEANGMREGDAWEHLKSFVSVLAAISIAMAKMVEGTAAEADPVVWTFQQLALEFKAKLKRF